MNEIVPAGKMTPTNEIAPDQDYVLRTIRERGVRMVRLWFTDVLGQLKSVAISPAETAAAFAEGVQFDGTAIDGFSRVNEADLLARPDATTFALLPWADSDEPTGRMFCDMETLDGQPFDGDPRGVLRRTLASAQARGYTLMAAPEVEYFYFDSNDQSNGPQPLDKASYFDLTTFDSYSNLRLRTLHMLEAIGIPVGYSFHEDSPSQHEIDLRYTEALSMADNVMTLRLVVKRTAMAHGVYATFMPKPINGVQGSGMHTHLSLFKGDRNIFADYSDTLDESIPDHRSLDPKTASKNVDTLDLSNVGRYFMAGVLAHARELTAVTNQLVNSYKRLDEHSEAPQHVVWARHNRSALVRVPVHKQHRPETARIEYRALDSACNPYLAFSLLLAAGLRGIEHGYELPPEATGGLHRQPLPETAGQHREDSPGSPPRLPRSLEEALDVMESSQLVRDTLGEHIFEWFLRNKRAEWRQYQEQVTPWEMKRYLHRW